VSLFNQIHDAGYKMRDRMEREIINYMEQRIKEE
jgi:hypothetical protein